MRHQGASNGGGQMAELMQILIDSSMVFLAAASLFMARSFYRKARSDQAVRAILFPNATDETFDSVDKGLRVGAIVVSSGAFIQALIILVAYELYPSACLLYTSPSPRDS